MYDKSVDYYEDKSRKCTIQLIKKHATKSQCGVSNQPLIEIDLDRVVPDVLHLCLRITDVLEQNLFLQAVKCDAAKRIAKRCRTGTSENTTTGEQSSVQQLKHLFRSCGVSFDVWEAKDDKKIDGLNWTSLSGTEKNKVLENLPNKLRCSEIFDADHRTTVADIWEEFKDILQLVKNPPEENIKQTIFDKCQHFLKTFLSIKEVGYTRVKPYMHSLLYHVPHFVDRYGSLTKFSCQMIEKTNDTIKKIFQRKSQKWDACKECLTVKKRMDAAKEQNIQQRIKRSYRKRKSEYWTTEIYEKAKRCRYYSSN